MVEQIAVLLALAADLFDPVPLEKMTDAERWLRKATTALPADVVERLTSAGKLSDDDRKAILDVATKALASFSPKAEPKPAAKPAK
jgi:F-type H+-transporting ATPase subunit alpha